MMTTLAWMGAGIGSIPRLREIWPALKRNAPGKASRRRGEGRIHDRISDKLCKNCDPYQRIFPSSAINGAAHTQYNCANCISCARRVPEVPLKLYHTKD